MQSNALNEFNEGVALYKKGQHDAALTKFGTAIKLDQQFSEAYDNRGYIYLLRKQYAQALTDFSNAIRSNNQNALAYCNRGQVYMNQQLYDKALTDYTQAVRLEPKNAAFHSDRATALMKLKRFDEAIQGLSQAIQIDPNLSVVYYNIGLALVQQNKTVNAIPFFERAARGGMAMAGAAAVNFKQQLFQKALEDRTAVDVVMAVVDARSLGEIQNLVKTYPYVTLELFQNYFEDGLNGHLNRMTKQEKSFYNDQTLVWLKQMVDVNSKTK
jgi:tetratricopeptide (TPR) repeat protein